MQKQEKAKRVKTGIFNMIYPIYSIHYNLCNVDKIFSDINTHHDNYCIQIIAANISVYEMLNRYLLCVLHLPDF